MREATTTASGTGLHRSLSTGRIVYLVVAAAAPLAGVVGTVPLAFAIGNGAGVPGAFALAGLILLCFSVGYAAMSRRIVSTGGFYTYMSYGLGRPPAVAGGLVAVVAYNTATIGLAGALGYFAQIVAKAHGIDLPWEAWGAIGIALVGFMGYHQIDMSARLLSVVMICEVAILTALSVSIVVHDGGSALPATSFSPHTVLGSQLGVTLMFAFVSFIGVESAANYGEETPNPRRSVPIATYLSVALIAVFYTVMSWTAVGALGADKLRAVANKELGDLFFGLSDNYLNGTATTIMQVLMCTSLFGATLGLHNAANRYMYALGRESVLPGWVGGVHSRHGAPHAAALLQTGITAVVVAAFALAGLHPYVNLATSMLGIGTLGIVILQASAVLSALGYFRNDPERHWWRTMLAPLLGLAGLVAAVVLIVTNFPLVTGSKSVVVNSLPWLYVVAAVGGLAYAWWMRSARPERYAGLATPAAPTEPEAAMRAESLPLQAG
ncbi:MAG: APC family permease [Frankiaceae bacterium]